MNIKITKHDICTYVINLERCKHKKEFISNQLKKTGIVNFNIIKAFDATQFTDDYINNLDESIILKIYKDWILKNKDQRGHFGCSLSHYNVLNKFINNHKEKYLLVFEDDCFIIDNFLEELLKILNEHINLDYDLLLGGYNCDSDYFKNPEHCKLNKNYTELKSGLKYKLRKIHYFIGTHCYIINRNKATKILKDLLPHRWYIDHQLSSFIKEKNYNVYGIFEPIAFSQGDNIITEFNYKNKVNWQFGSQTQSNTNKECFTDLNNKFKLKNFLMPIIIIIIIFIVFLYLLFKNIINY